MKIYHGAVEWWTSGGALYEYASPTSDARVHLPSLAAVVMLPMAFRCPWPLDQLIATSSRWPWC